MRRYFITGGTGFIGREIVRQLIEREDTDYVTCLTRGKRKNLLQHDKVRYWQGDITEVNLPLEGWCFTDLIHGACDANDLHYQDSKDIYYTSVEGTKRIMEWSVWIPNRLILSSGAVSRDTVYGRSKKLCEQISPPDVKIARIFSVIGEEMPMNGQFAAGKFIWQAMNEGKVSVYKGNSWRSYIDIKDCGKWLIKILDKGVQGKIYDVAGYEQVMVNALAARIASIWGVPLVDIEGPIRNDKYLPNINSAFLLDCEHTFTLRESLERIHAYMQDTKSMLNILNNGYQAYYVSRS